MCTSIQPSGLISKLFNKSYKIKCSSISDVKDDVFKNTWVINLKRRSDRWDLSNSRLNSIGIYPKRFNAVDAKNKNIINLYNTIDHPKRTINEVACYLSHKKLWRRIYELNLPYALIFEDDVFIGDKINKTSIMDAVKNSIGFNIIFLGHCHGNILNFSFPETKVGSALCLNAYIVSRTGVEKLLQQDDDFSKPIDHFTRDLCKDNLCFLSKTTHTPGMYGQGIIKQDDVNLKSNLRDRSKLIETVL
jgi:glycosyl transferase family 25